MKTKLAAAAFILVAIHAAGAEDKDCPLVRRDACAVAGQFFKTDTGCYSNNNIPFVGVTSRCYVEYKCPGDWFITTVRGICFKNAKELCECMTKDGNLFPESIKESALEQLAAVFSARPGELCREAAVPVTLAGLPLRDGESVESVTMTICKSVPTDSTALAPSAPTGAELSTLAAPSR